ncbi:MAG: hypothetical protein KAJ62_00960 [Desulfobacteraceae bacterium]|nr:hypothetical protein [Desulfobacteraceae bacterium]
MIELFSFEFWIGIQFIIDLFIILCFLVFVKRVRNTQLSNQYNGKGRIDQENAEKATNDIIEMLEPFVKESKITADSFDKQIKEKRKLISELNESLDSRIISINLLISRAEAAKEDLRNLRIEVARQPIQPLPSKQNSNLSENVLDQQNSILDMYNNGFDIDAIVSKLSMPKGEVKLVIDLKKKFKAMELQD